MDEVIGFDQFKGIFERHLVFDSTIEIGDHPGSEGELDKFNMPLETGRGEDLSFETKILLIWFYHHEYTMTSCLFCDPVLYL